jgi:arylsulfatase A
MKFMKKRSILGLLIVFILNTINAQTDKKPNIIFILADDLGYTDLGCYGNPFNETPNIDKLAKSGVKMTQAYASCPVCSPSRASILTGKYPARLNFTSHMGGNLTDSLSTVSPPKTAKSLPTSEVTIAEKLKALGYATGMVGKWHVGDIDTEKPWGQGFDYSRMIAKNGLDYYNYSIFEDSQKKEFKDSGTNYLTDKLTDYALEFIQLSTKAKKPFYLSLSYSAPHVLLVPKAQKLSKYLMKHDKFKGKYNPSYAAVIESMDDGVGKVMQKLKDLNLLDNTIVVFTSDNGGVGLDELGPTPTNLEPLRKWKGFAYEGGIRVPAIISWAGTIPKATKNDDYFINTDYFPTFLELLKQPIPNWIDGKSILSILKDPSVKFNRGDIYWHYPHFSNQGGRPVGAIRDGKWKLVKSLETNALELFDLDADISEANDLKDKFPEIAKEMHQKLLDWQGTIKASMPIKK